MPDTVAVIDVGSNSIKLLVARAGPDANTLEARFSETIETRISAGISREIPSLSESAIAAGTETIRELHRLALQYQPMRTAIVATSAVRDAINGHDFIGSVFEATGLRIRILNGMEEASYIGRGLSYDPAIAGMTSFIQTDLGGGSLELIRFEAGDIKQATSLQLGAVRLTERFVEDKDAALCPKAEAAIRAHVTEQLRDSGFDFSHAAWPLIATGGAFTISRAVLAAQAGLTIDARSPQLERPALDALKRQLARLPLHERLSIPHLPAARADIIPVALIIIDALLDVSGYDRLTHSFYNLRYGIAANLIFSQM